MHLSIKLCKLCYIPMERTDGFWGGTETCDRVLVGWSVAAGSAGTAVFTSSLVSSPKELKHLELVYAISCRALELPLVTAQGR